MHYQSLGSNNLSVHNLIFETLCISTSITEKITFISLKFVMCKASLNTWKSYTLKLYCKGCRRF